MNNSDLDGLLHLLHTRDKNVLIAALLLIDSYKIGIGTVKEVIEIIEGVIALSETSRLSLRGEIK